VRDPQLRRQSALSERTLACHYDLRRSLAGPPRVQSVMTIPTFVAAGRMRTRAPRLRLLHRILTVFALSLLTQCVSMPDSDGNRPHVYVLYALGGVPTSLGMVSLADRIQNLGGITVSTYAWDDTRQSFRTSPRSRRMRPLPSSDILWGRMRPPGSRRVCRIDPSRC
jgi:hypothetical protein